MLNPSSHTKGKGRIVSDSNFAASTLLNLLTEATGGRYKPESMQVTRNNLVLLENNNEGVLELTSDESDNSLDKLVARMQIAPDTIDAITIQSLGELLLGTSDGRANIEAVDGRIRTHQSMPELRNLIAGKMQEIGIKLRNGTIPAVDPKNIT